MNITKSLFGKTTDGTEVYLYTLINNDMQVKITNYGGTITSVFVPDVHGKMDDVVLGFDNIEGYLKGCPYFGALVGRFGNRIAGGKFTLNGVMYTLAQNNGPNHLHGGLNGFDKAVWKADMFQNSDNVGLNLAYTSVDGEEGYPGNLDVKVTYTLTSDNSIRIDYYATTDKTTIINLTNHTYFNLKDGGKSPILDHEIMIAAKNITPVNENLIPTGELMNVKRSPFDFNKMKTIGAHIDSDHQQIKLGGGYDHNYIFDPEREIMDPVARVKEATTGRILDVFTTEPAMQFYSGNFLDGTLTGKHGHVYGRRHGFCLETQHYPDSPNQPEFPSTVLKPGEEYRTSTEYKFSTTY